jgi:hypothetical protein
MRAARKARPSFYPTIETALLARRGWPTTARRPPGRIAQPRLAPLDPAGYNAAMVPREALSPDLGPLPAVRARLAA